MRPGLGFHNGRNLINPNKNCTRTVGTRVGAAPQLDVRVNKGP